MRCEVVRLLAGRGGVPLVIARGRDQASRSLECGTKHRLLGYRLGSRVERGRRFLSHLFPPGWHQPPPHRHQLTLGVALDHRVDRGSGADVVARLQIASGQFRRGQPVKLVNLAPGQSVSETSAHACKISMLCAGGSHFRAIMLGQAVFFDG